ncbi:DUF6255 family natural product biosynthesis protein [Streptomyces thioluteus]
MSHCRHLSGWESANGEDRCPHLRNPPLSRTTGALRPEELRQQPLTSPAARPRGSQVATVSS